MKKLINAFVLVFVLMVVGAFTIGCKKKGEVFKVGLITLHDETSTYDNNFIQAAKNVAKKLELSDDQLIIKQAEENDECLNTCKDLVDQGCDIIFADSFGHESFLIEAANKYKGVEFCHATGTSSKFKDLQNFHNAFASIYEGRYLTGVAAGMKLNAMIEAGTITASQAKMGYIGAYTYAEVVSGLTSFYLGAKSVCPTVTMEVTFTGSWFDPTAESESATSLINNGCKLISQHADSMGAPGKCEQEKVPNVSYNGSTKSACENSYLVASKINWEVYFEYIFKAAKENKRIDTDWCGNLNNGAVELCELNEKVAAAGTKAKLDEVMAGLKNGTIKVFDTTTFTVNGQQLTNELISTLKAQKITSAPEAVVNGVFEESDANNIQSAPYFDFTIDGITFTNTKF